MAAFQSGKKTKAKLPISKHPLFPAMVALWFAALFGLGSLAIRPTLLEKFVLSLHLDVIVPAAAPPLGFTSRILLALMMFVIGGAIGFVVARKVAGAGTERGKARPAQASAPVFKAGAADDEDFDRLDAAKPAASYQIPGRRRALAMEEDYVNDYRDHAPLPGQILSGHEPQILDLATLGGLTEYTDPAESGQAEPVIESQPVQVATAETTFDPWNRHAPEAPAAEVPEEVVPTVVDAPVQDDSSRAFDAPAEPFGRTEVRPFEQPVDFHRPAFAAPEVQPEEPAVEAETIANTQPARAFDPAPVAAPAEAVASEQAAPQAAQSVGLGLMPRDAVEKLTSAPLASLGVVQLAERLALAIARRKTPGEEAPALAVPVAFESAPPAFAQPEPVASFAEPEPQPEPEAIAPALPVEPAPVLAAEPPRETAIPRAMRPLSWDDDEDEEDEALHSILPPRRFAMPATAAAEKVPEPAPLAPEPVAAAAPDEEDESFGSLLGMKPTLRQSFVRVDEPVEPEAPVEPVVIFPGQAPRFASVARPFEAPAQPAPAPAAAPSPEPTPIEAGRRFDAPSAIPAAMTAFTPSSGPAIDPEETERALKAALATLQRMSGAA